MNSDNPFVKLGLQKEIVESLRRQGRLEDFLRTYYRSIQMHIHPDHGGDSALAAAINSAYATIQQRPSDIGSWVKNMSNGNDVNPEHLAMIEGLVAKVEEYQGMEKDYRDLQRQYAELLVSRTGDGIKAEVRKAAPRARREESFEDEFTGAPEIKKPKAKRVDVDADVGREAKSKERAVPAKPIILSDLVSYDMKGKPVAKYTAYLDGEAVRNADGSYLVESQREFEKYFASAKDGRRLPNLPELYAIIEQLHDTKNPALDGIVRDMAESWLCTGTGINYKDNTIIHSGYAPIKCAIPAGNHWVDEVIKDKEWRKVMQALFGSRNVERVPEMLNAITGKRLYIWAPDAYVRKSHPERAVWLLIYTDRFYLNCGLNPIDILGRARGVRLESA